MGLAFEQAYTFRVRTAEGSRVSVGVTTEITTEQEVLASVQSLTATANGRNITLSWQNPPDANYETIGISGEEIVVSGNVPLSDSSSMIANTATTHTFSNLNYFTDYTFEVTTTKSGLDSQSQTVTQTTPPTEVGGLGIAVITASLDVTGAGFVYYKLGHRSGKFQP